MKRSCGAIAGYRQWLRIMQGQKASIYEYANKQGWQIDRIVQTMVSSRKGEKERGIDVLKDAVREGKVDVIIFSELSRLARSVGQICRLVEFFVKDSRASLHFIKEGLVLEDGKRALGTKVTFFMFSMLAEIERDLISERTREALAARKAQGVVLGRRRGSRILNRRGDEIRDRIDQFFPLIAASCETIPRCQGAQLLTEYTVDVVKRESQCQGLDYQRGCIVKRVSRPRA